MKKQIIKGVRYCKYCYLDEYVVDFYKIPCRKLKVVDSDVKAINHKFINGKWLKKPIIGQ